MKRRAFLAVPAVAALGACSPGTTVDPNPSPTPTDRTGQTIADLGPVTLTVWDQEVLSGQDAQMEALNAQFQDQFPNVTVRRLSQSFDDLRKQTAIALAGDDVPDVVQINNTRAEMGEYVRAGRLLSLSPSAATFGWEARFPRAALDRARYAPDTDSFGDGDVYGVPQTGSLVGFYYLQETLDRLGGERPSTWDELFALLDAARGAGEQPMAFGNLEKWPALQLLGPLQTAFVSSAEALTLARGSSGGDWTSDGNLSALAKLGAWGSEGYLGDSPNSMDYEAGWRYFAEGKAAFLPGGSWLSADLDAEVEEGLRFMAPPAGLDSTVATPGGTGVPWSIPAKSAHPEVAAAYLDFITSPSAMETVAANGGVPVLRTRELVPEGGVLGDIYEAYTLVSQEGTLLPYLDNATPTFGDTAGTALQELIAGQRDPESTAATLQEDYAGFVS